MELIDKFLFYYLRKLGLSLTLIYFVSLILSFALQEIDNTLGGLLGLLVLFAVFVLPNIVITYLNYKIYRKQLGFQLYLIAFLSPFIMLIDNSILISQISATVFILTAVSIITINAFTLTNINKEFKTGNNNWFVNLFLLSIFSFPFGLFVIQKNFNRLADKIENIWNSAE